MKKKVFSPFMLVMAAVFLMSIGTHRAARGAGVNAAPRLEIQPQEVKKPQDDYMSKFTERSTDPTGLNVNPAVERFLNQPGIKWAVRGSRRHILH